ncbi:hypothetical protein AYK24_06335 [Thermoplasmatales archaeon SG8-52-4]|nr:MAG: hypothetical protein AYK24_06335 [Thermoplasmatales archaeon SG8-52-4]
MPCLKDWEKKFVIYEINVLLAEMGFFSKLKKKKIKFNTNLITDNQQCRIENFNETEKNLVDLQYDITKNIDKLIKQHEKKSNDKEYESILNTKQELPFNKIIELRDQETKKPEMPLFPTELNSESFYGELNKNKELFEVEIPNNVTSNNNQYFDISFDNLSLDENKKPQRFFMDIGKIKFWNKSSNQNQSESKKVQGQFNDFNKTEVGLERTKRDIEEQERTLEYAKKMENKMKNELKEKNEQKKKEEKLRKLEYKKKIKEDRLRQLQAEKAKKQIEKEERKLKREKLKEEKFKEKEMRKLELIKQNEEKIKKREIERLEKLKLKEIKRLQEEKERAEKQKEILLKEKQKDEELRLKKLEQEKIEKQKEILLKEKQRAEELKAKKLEQEINGEIKSEEPPEMGKFIQKETGTKNEKHYLDDDVEKLLPIIDQLLEKLPDEVVDEFAQSDNFALYEKVINKYKRK